MSVTHEGPFDVQPWPDVLTARVVTPGAQPRMHGYDCEGDLARHASLAEGTLLALTGELPTAGRTRAFEIAMSFLAPVPVNEAPTHAAVVARLCSGSTSSILATAALALGEQARDAISRLAAHWEWLAAPQGHAPEPVRATDEACTQSVERLRVALRDGGIPVAALEHDLARTPAIVAVLIACGLTRPHQVEAAWVVARLPVCFAEAMAETPGNLKAYPWDLPRFRYEEDPR